MSDKGAQTRRNIIEKSLQLFSVKGYFNTSIRDILEPTELTKGGLYGHFPSKEDIWYAVYDEAVGIWRGIVFKDVREKIHPIDRVECFIENDLRDYLGAEVFTGGCFFLNMLVELSGQSTPLSRHILRGFVQLSRLLHRWFEEADREGLLRKGLDHREIANFIVISLNGASALYVSSRDPLIVENTVTQLRFYLHQLKR